MATFGIEINDLRHDRENIIKLEGWQTAESAAEAAWQLLVLTAEFDPTLDYENQGDQFMAYYGDGVTDEETGDLLDGSGAVIFKIVNPDGTYYEDL